ncbi:MAG: toxin-antitoxin system HicB family antitoxin [Pirellulaceae bacterium]|nr:toxin-antitoxin system HicB family antitoxin [Pirellulaceae bacterium]
MNDLEGAIMNEMSPLLPNQSLSLEASSPPMEESPRFQLEPPATVEEGCEKAFHIAAELYNKTPDWVTFFREVLGVGGVVRQLFPDANAMAEFESSAEYAQIQQMLSKLREKPQPHAEDKEPTRVITVRMPKSLHESLRAEAHNRRTSMNKLCISKLLQVIGGELLLESE